MALTERYVSSTGTDTWANATNSATPASWATMLTDAVAGDSVNIKQDGTYTLAASSVMTAAGSTTSPIVLRGYKTTIGDGNTGRTNGNGALTVTNMPVISFDATFKLTVLGATILESLNISTNNSATSVSLGANCVVRNCKIANPSNNSAAGIFTATAGPSVIIGNDLLLTNANAASVNINGSNITHRIIANRLQGGIAISTTSGHIISAFNVFLGTTTHIRTTSAAGMVTSISDDLQGASADGVAIVTTSTALHCFANGMLTDNGAFGINFTSAAAEAVIASMRYRDNTSGPTNLGTDWVSATSWDIVSTDTGGPETDYTDAATQDFRLISASPAKAAGILPYLDIGALQRQEAGGGAARRFVQNL